MLVAYIGAYIGFSHVGVSMRLVVRLAEAICHERQSVCCTLVRTLDLSFSGHPRLILQLCKEGTCSELVYMTRSGLD